MERVKIAIIGLGWFGEIHCDAISGIPNLEIAALCTRNESRLAELSKKYGVKDTYTDYRDVLARDDIDAVSIVTMWDQHTDPTVAALAAGKHVFLEKPMASTVEDCRKIVAAAGDWGAYVAAHTFNDRSVGRLLDCGVKTFEGSLRLGLRRWIRGRRADAPLRDLAAHQNLRRHIRGAQAAHVRRR